MSSQVDEDQFLQGLHQPIATVVLWVGGLEHWASTGLCSAQLLGEGPAAFLAFIVLSCRLTRVAVRDSRRDRCWEMEQGEGPGPSNLWKNKVDLFDVSASASAGGGGMALAGPQWSQFSHLPAQLLFGSDAQGVRKAELLAAVADLNPGFVNFAGAASLTLCFLLEQESTVKLK